MRLPRLSLAELMVVGGAISLLAWANTIVWRGELVRYDEGEAQTSFAYWYQGWPGMVRKLCYSYEDGAEYWSWEPLGVATNAVVGAVLIPGALYLWRRACGVANSLRCRLRRFSAVERADVHDPFGSLKASVMPYVMVDVESDGPIPGEYSMISFGAVIVEPGLERTFYGQLKPISEKFVPEALAVSGFTREECLAFDDPAEVMSRFADWLSAECKGRMLFVSDNNGFDWQFVNWYFHRFLGRNPFGFSSTNLGSLYKGMQKDTFVSFKHLRKTAHTHHPVDDAKGNAEALLAMKEMGLKIRLD